jgi:formylglycine-generating enzyme required for sulfatase activity
VARIFLCHASEDKAQVREVYHRLRAIDGFEPWLDEEDLLPGQEWEREIPRALQTSDFILVFFSRASVAKRGYIQREMKLALDAWQEVPEGTIHTIPVRLDACDVPQSFRRYQWVNLFNPNGFDRIVCAIRTELAKRPGTAQLAIPQPPPSINRFAGSVAKDTVLEPLRANSIDIDVVPFWQTVLTNSIGMEFVLIPAGTFMMGSPDSDAESWLVERPAHHVTISQPFYLGKYPVTQAQWEAVTGYNPSGFKGHPNQPVENVSWNDALTFLQKLNAREGCGDYCLPTEAQWEYACRAGTETPRYHPDVNAIAWYQGHSHGSSQPVGQILPNAWGLYDMLGNVWEWCHDGLRTYTADAAVDPMGPTGAGIDRVFRGGGWSAPVLLVRAAYRIELHPGFHDDSLGFRCACSVRQR